MQIINATFQEFLSENNLTTSFFSNVTNNK